MISTSVTNRFRHNLEPVLYVDVCSSTSKFGELVKGSAAID